MEGKGKNITLTFMTIPVVTSEMFDLRSASSEDEGCDVCQLAVSAKYGLSSEAKIADVGK